MGRNLRKVGATKNYFKDNLNYFKDNLDYFKENLDYSKDDFGFCARKKTASKPDIVQNLTKMFHAAALMNNNQTKLPSFLTFVILEKASISNRRISDSK